MTNRFNPVAFMGTGFEYSLRGNVSGGFTVVTNLSTAKRHFATLEEAHKAINRSFRVFMANRG